MGDDLLMAEAIAHFLCRSSYLQHAGNVAGVTLYTEDGQRIEMGVWTFDRLKASLDKHYPDWQGWNNNYRKSEPAECESSSGYGGVVDREDYRCPHCEKLIRIEGSRIPIDTRANGD